jgi:predicted phage terminase large subunit-like protein
VDIIPPSLEELDQELARRDLLNFAKHVKPDYIVGPQHKILAEKLEAVERGELKRLIVCMPPRHGKSLLSTQLFPAWALGKNPKLEIIQSGYSHDITMEHSRLARDFFVSEEYKKIFRDVHHVPGRQGQAGIAVARQAASEWGTKQKGKYYAVGVGGGITGRGADIAIIDDPVKNREDAESPTIQKKIWDWYRSTLYTRLSPEGAIILVMTRWNTNDLAGKLIKAMTEGGEQWEVVSMPAIDESGCALWPARWPAEKLKVIEETLGKYEWSSLYQQRPTVRGGNRFKVDLIQVHEDPKDFPDVSYVRFWDLASTVKERDKDDPDATSGAKCGITIEDGLPHLWIIDIKWCQEEAPERDKMIMATTKADGPSVKIGVESVAGYKDTYTTMKVILKGLRIVKKITVSGDKSVRAAPLEPVMEAGHVHILRARWNEKFFEEFAGFPSTGVHDDIVDSTAGAYAMLVKPEPKFFDRRLIRA